MSRLFSALFSLVAAACGSAQEEGPTLGLVEGFAGLVVADEPRAALVGRDILASGGTAADAAVAMYFTMAVSLPSRTSLAGGGLCLAFDHEDKRAEVIDFLPRRGPSGAVVPRGVRAMAALHARHGFYRWEGLIVPAENLARFGNAASRALVRDLEAAASIVAADRDMARIFRQRSGLPLREGDRITQFELATALAGIRQQGAGYFHSGPFARRFAEASRLAGQPLTAGELLTALPDLRSPARVQFGNETLYFPGPPASRSRAASLWLALAEIDAADAPERARLLIEAMQETRSNPDSGSDAQGVGPGAVADWTNARFSERQVEVSFQPPTTLEAALPSSPASVPGVWAGAGLVVGDRWGNAVACGLTLNGLFGAGRSAPGTGIVLTAPPTRPDQGWRSLSVAILANEVNGDAHLAVAASGGEPAQSAMAEALLAALIRKLPLDEALAEPRLHLPSGSDVVLHEPLVAPSVMQALSARGFSLQEIPKLGRVNAFRCEQGLIDHEAGCDWAADPRAWGLGTLVQ